eukprot:503097_1
MTSNRWFVPQINDFVQLETVRKKGYIRYIGPLIGAKYDGIFYGIELEKHIGKNNGGLDGHKYFQCKKNYGLFVKRNKIKNILIKCKSFEYKIELIISNLFCSSNIINIFPFEIYKLILFYIPPPKLYFTADQKGLDFFKIHKNRLKISTPSIRPLYGFNGSRDFSKIALLRFKDNCVSINNSNTIHQTFPILRWRYSNFKTFKLKLLLKCIAHFNRWTLGPYSSQTTYLPTFVLLDSFKSHKNKKNKKLLHITFENQIKKEFEEKEINLFGEKINNANKWRYWIETEYGKTKQIETKNPIEIGFQFKFEQTSSISINSNVKILKQQWTFY